MELNEKIINFKLQNFITQKSASSCQRGLSVVAFQILYTKPIYLGLNGPTKI